MPPTPPAPALASHQHPYHGAMLRTQITKTNYPRMFPCTVAMPMPMPKCQWFCNGDQPAAQLHTPHVRRTSGGRPVCGFVPCTWVRWSVVLAACEKGLAGLVVAAKTHHSMPYLPDSLTLAAVVIVWCGAVRCDDICYFRFFSCSSVAAVLLLLCCLLLAFVDFCFVCRVKRCKLAVAVIHWALWLLLSLCPWVLAACCLLSFLRHVNPLPCRQCICCVAPDWRAYTHVCIHPQPASQPVLYALHRAVPCQALMQFGVLQ